MMIGRIPALVLALAASACAQTGAAPGSTTGTAELFKSLGGLQCSDPGTRPEMIAAELRGAGIEILAMHCAHDGRMRPQMCGAPDGRIVVVVVPAAQREAALAQGLAPLSMRPDAQRLPCR